MNAMKFADDGSTGAAETSWFHQLVGGNSGVAPRSAAPCTGTCGGHWACAVVTPASASAIVHRMRVALVKRARIALPLLTSLS